MSGCTRRLDAMKDAKVPIEIVFIDRKYLVFRGGLKVKLRYLNEDGFLTDNVDEAVAYEFGNEKFGFGRATFDQEEFTDGSQ